MSYQITDISIVRSTACSSWQLKENQSSASLAFCEVNPPMYSPHKGSVMRETCPWPDATITFLPVSYQARESSFYLHQGFHKNHKKSPMIFSWLLQARSKFPDKKTNKAIFVFAAHVSNCRINYRQTQTHTHTQTHIWFDQGQPTIQLILLAVELWFKKSQLHLLKG